MEANLQQSISSVNTLGSKVKAAGRLLYIDNIRTYLTALVIAHHLMIIYAGSGGWIYYDGHQDEITAAIGGWFCAVNQAYFMGLFLFIAAYFVPGAYDRKGSKKFVIDRLVRLGIPLVFYSWILRPLLIYVGDDPGLSFRTWYQFTYFRVYGILGGGPLWFIETLLGFSLIYALVRIIARKQPAVLAKETAFPKNSKIILFTLLLGIVSFAVRIITPVNNSFAPLNLQFANFTQYIALFAAGLAAYRKNWLDTLTDQAGKIWLRVAIALILVYPPLGLLAKSFGGTEPFLGGWHWQSMIFAQWESFVCVGACIGLVYLFRRRFNAQGRIARELSRGAYATYLIHEPVISFLASMSAGIMIYPLLKFTLACAVLIPVCFLAGSLIRRLPYADRVL